MPSVFRTHFKTIGFPTLRDQFGESITYFLRSGGRRTFDAVVIRRPIEVYVPGGTAIAKYTIRFEDTCDETKGLTSTDIDTGGDEVELIADEGDASKTRVTVISKVSQSNGVIELALAGD